MRVASRADSEDEVLPRGVSHINLPYGILGMHVSRSRHINVYDLTRPGLLTARGDDGFQ